MPQSISPSHEERLPRSMGLLAAGVVFGIFTIASCLIFITRGPVGIAPDQATWDPAPYQAEVEEGLGAALAIVIDTSGSMEDTVSGDTRPKFRVALSAIQEMLDATDDFVARRPDFPIRIAIYRFSSDAWQVMPIQAYDRAKVQQALVSVPRPGGGTAIGEAMYAARPELYRAGTFRKYLLVVTDGENTTGRDPKRMARHIYDKSEGAVQIYFVAFDTSPGKFAFLKDVGGDVIAAGNGVELRKALDEIYQGKILAEEIDVGETDPIQPVSEHE